MTKSAIDEKIDEITRRIVKDFQPEKIILFGSYAWGNPGPDSDVDLFVVKDTENTRQFAMEIDGTFWPRPFPMDIIVYKPENAKKRLQMGDFFIQDIFTKGKLLYERK